MITIPFAKLHCRAGRLKVVVMLGYLGSLVAGLGALAVGVARVGRALAQQQMNNLGDSVGEVVGAFDAAHKRSSSA